MAADDEGTSAPSLEPPSFGFGRKRRQKAAATPAPAPAEGPPEAGGGAASQPDAQADPEPAGPVDDRVAEPDPEAAESAPWSDTAHVEDVPDDAEPVVAAPSMKEQAPAEATPEPTLAEDPPAEVGSTRPAEEDASADGSPTTVDADQPTAPATTEEEPRAATAAPATALTLTPAAREQSAGTATTVEPAQPTGGAPLRGRTAAAVAGLLAGGVLAGGTALSTGVCRWSAGTSSCGGAGGLLLLGVVLALSALVGAWILRWAREDYAGSTSVLALGIVAIVAMLVLGDHLLAWWMVVVVPVLAIGAYLFSHWVTNDLIDSVEE